VEVEVEVEVEVAVEVEVEDEAPTTTAGALESVASVEPGVVTVSGAAASATLCAADCVESRPAT